jgi:hypothetical protein
VKNVVHARARIVLGLIAVALPLAACSDLDDPASAQAVSRNDLIAQLAAQLNGSSASLTYAATYQLAGGATGTITQAQSPARAAFRYPGGVVLISEDATTICAKKSCTVSAPPVAAASPPAAVFTAARRTGLVPPSAVFELLTAAALDTDMTVDQHDTTIAGRHATCVELAGVDDAAASAFATCITNEGVLGSFTGTLNGKAMDVAMTDYADQVSGDAFELPVGAKTVDHR